MLEEDPEEAIRMDNINLREKTSDRVIFRKLPIALWVVGVVIFLITIYLMASLIVGSFGHFDKETPER